MILSSSRATLHCGYLASNRIDAEVLGDSGLWTMEMQGAVIVRSSPIVQAEYAARIYKHHPEFRTRRLSAADVRRDNPPAELDRPSFSFRRRA